MATRRFTSRSGAGALLLFLAALVVTTGAAHAADDFWPLFSRNLFARDESGHLMWFTDRDLPGFFAEDPVLMKVWSPKEFVRGPGVD